MIIKEFLEELAKQNLFPSKLPMYFKDGSIYYPITRIRVDKLGVTGRDVIIISSPVD